MSRALVLGGGGPVGIGWESGLVTGFAEAGVDLAAADLVIGTSAGSVVGVQLVAGLDQEGILAQAAEPLPVISDEQVLLSIGILLETLRTAIGNGSSYEQTRQAVGKVALSATTVAEQPWVDKFSSVKGVDWPERYRCTAVDAVSGELRVWDRDSGVPLQQAVASSCAVPALFPPVTIGGRRYMDGGMRTGLNADLAEGHDAVLAVSCMPLSLPEGWHDPVADATNAMQQAELEHLVATGAKLEVVGPDAEFLELSGWGAFLMDSTRVRAAFDAGRRQAAEEATRVSSLWNAGR